MTGRLSETTAFRERDNRARAFALGAKSLAAAGGRYADAALDFERNFPASAYGDVMRKAAASAGSTGNWGAPLAEAGLASDFLSVLAPRTLLGRLPMAREAPFDLVLPRLGATPRGSWTGQGQPLRVVNPGTDTVTLPRRRVGAILVVSNELAKAGGDLAARLFERALSDAVSAALDATLLDPALAASSASPASITHGAPSFPAASLDADAVAAAADAALDTITSDLNGLCFVASPRVALLLARLRFPSGQRAFPEAGATGGTVLGAPLLVSPAAPAGQLAVLDGERLVYARGDAETAISEHALIELGEAAGEAPLSLWQSNSQGIRATVVANWQIEDGAVSVVTGLGE